jgi:RNA polymerase sigma factor (sigma-70 family)
VSETQNTSPFAATRWTLVLRAKGESVEAQTALSELCEVYYQPVLRFLRRDGRDEDAARELAQEFFARILSRGGFDGADPERGRFRSYVLGALKHFLSDLRDRELRQKRGSGVAPESLDSSVEHETSPGLQVADVGVVAPDVNFDREWALIVMARALEELQREMKATGKSDQFAVLKPWLMGDAPSMSQSDAARKLGINEGAVKVAVHRLRKRFRDAVRTEIAQTLRDPAMVDEELQHLIAALS